MVAASMFSIESATVFRNRLDIAEDRMPRIDIITQSDVFMH